MFCYINLTDCRKQGKSVHEEYSEKGSESIYPLRLQTWVLIFAQLLSSPRAQWFRSVVLKLHPHFWSPSGEGKEKETWTSIITAPLLPVLDIGFGLVAKSCPILMTSWTVAFQAPLSIGFPRQEYWSGLSFPFLGDLSDPGIEPTSPAFQADFLKIYFNWRLITLQYCGGFCHVFTWLSHGCACVPHPDPPSYLSPHPIQLVQPLWRTVWWFLKNWK